MYERTTTCEPDKGSKTDNYISDIVKYIDTYIHIQLWF